MVQVCVDTQKCSSVDGRHGSEWREWIFQSVSVERMCGNVGSSPSLMRSAHFRSEYGVCHEQYATRVNCTECTPQRKRAGERRTNPSKNELEMKRIMGNLLLRAGSILLYLVVHSAGRCHATWGVSLGLNFAAIKRSLNPELREKWRWHYSWLKHSRKFMLSLKGSLWVIDRLSWFSSDSYCKCNLQVTEIWKTVSGIQ